MKFTKFLSLVFLGCFICTAIVEARPNPRSRHVSTATRKANLQNLKKKRETIAAKKRLIRTRVTKQRAHSRTALKRHRSSRIIATKRATQHQTVQTKTRQQSQAALKRSSRVEPLAQQKKPRQALPIKIKQAPPLVKPKAAFELLHDHTQNIAKLGRVDHLFAKNLLGQGQTIAPIESAGDWQELRNVVHNRVGSLSLEVRANYTRNFLPPIGGPGLDPNASSEWKRKYDIFPTHGSMVASTLLDLAPQAKVLPFSSYNCGYTNKTYYLADALMDLSRRDDVKVINVSGASPQGSYDVRIDGYNPDGSARNIYLKDTYSPKNLEAFKAIAKAGKVVVLGSGNDGCEIQAPYFSKKHTHSFHPLFAGYLFENLDAETRESIVYTGAIDPQTHKIASYSNRAGAMKVAQENFLCAPGTHKISYSGEVVEGTSFSTPYVSAAIADLMSRSPKITARQALQALKDSADRQADVKTYGRGIINARKALELLEERYLR